MGDGVRWMEYWLPARIGRGWGRGGTFVGHALLG